jgi:hypothetical protein
LRLEPLKLPLQATMLCGHSAYLLAMALPAAAAAAQPRLIEFEVGEAQEQHHGVHVVTPISPRGQLKPQQVGRGWLGLQLTLQGSLQKTHRQQGTAEAGVEQLYVY